MYHHLLGVLLIGSVALGVLAASAWKAFRHWRSDKRGRDAPHYEVWVGIVVVGLALPITSKIAGLDWSWVESTLSPRRDLTPDSADVRTELSPGPVSDSSASKTATIDVIPETRDSVPEVSALSCWSTSPTVYCSFTLMTRGEAMPRTLQLACNDIVVFDDRGKRYVAEWVQIGAQGASGAIQTYLPPESPIEVRFAVAGVDKFARRAVKVSFSAVRDGVAWEHAFSTPAEILN
jgi:hypothetical protein